jgi:hypothetical protein
MADLLIKQIPLPLPRPVMEETVLGSDKPGIEWNIPLPDTAGVDLSFPVVGTQWLLQPWNRMMELFTNERFFRSKTGGYELLLYNRFEEVIVFVFVLGGVSLTLAGVVFVLEKILPKRFMGDE